MSKILLIDNEINPGSDEPNMDYMWHYVKALEEAGHAVTAVNNVDIALEVLRKEGKTYDIVVVDIMMPPGNALAKVAHLRGMRTGIHLALRIAKDFPSLHIVALTNSHDSAIRKDLEPLKVPAVIVYKDDTTPFAFVRVVNGIVLHK